MINIAELTQQLASLGVAQQKDLVGVAPSSIQALEAHFGVQLPQAYHTFLLKMGRSAGYLSPWMAIYFDDLKEIREQFDFLNATLEKPITLPPNAFIIANWESVFDYFICGEQNDPAVFRVDLCKNIPSRDHNLYATSYSDYLNNLVQNANNNEIPTDLLEDGSADLLTEDVINF